MVKYAIKRIAMGLLSLFIVATLTFFLMQAVPGGPFMSEKAVSAQAMAALEAKYGLDQPVMVQYKNYLVNALHGDFGPSLRQRGRDVSEMCIRDRVCAGGGRR